MRQQLVAQLEDGRRDGALGLQRLELFSGVCMIGSPHGEIVNTYIPVNKGARWPRKDTYIPPPGRYKYNLKSARYK